jgi:hypothetical protein
MRHRQNARSPVDRPPPYQLDPFYRPAAIDQRISAAFDDHLPAVAAGIQQSGCSPPLSHHGRLLGTSRADVEGQQEPNAPRHAAPCHSAESRDPSSGSDASVTALPGRFNTCPAHDSAESPCSEIPSRSLLDAPLDEADAGRSAEAALSGMPETSSRPPKAERAPSVLQQRADATKRAFSRADALVSLAQGYLRGDHAHNSCEQPARRAGRSCRGG